MEITLCDAVAASAQSHFFFCFFSSSWTVSDLETSVWEREERRVREMEGEQNGIRPRMQPVGRRKLGTDQGAQLWNIGPI